MRRSKALVAAASVCVLLAAGCGGDDKESEEELVDEISETLQSGGQGFDEKYADCFAELVVEEVGVEELQDVDITADEPPEEIKADIAEAATRAAEECDLAGEE